MCGDERVENDHRIFRIVIHITMQINSIYIPKQNASSEIYESNGGRVSYFNICYRLAITCDWSHWNTELCFLDLKNAILLFYKVFTCVQHFHTFSGMPKLCMHDRYCHSLTSVYYYL